MENYPNNIRVITRTWRSKIRIEAIMIACLVGKYISTPHILHTLYDRRRAFAFFTCHTKAYKIYSALASCVCVKTAAYTWNGGPHAVKSNIGKKSGFNEGNATRITHFQSWLTYGFNKVTKIGRWNLWKRSLNFLRNHKTLRRKTLIIYIPAL